MHASATQALLEGEHPYGVQPEGNLLHEDAEFDFDSRDLASFPSIAYDAQQSVASGFQ